jgi:hypothetical protein
MTKRLEFTGPLSMNAVPTRGANNSMSYDKYR